MKRLFPLVVGSVALASLALTVAAPDPRLIWNASASAPVGPYWIAHREAQRGDFVAARLPSEVALLAAARGYLPSGVPVIKRLAATADDVLCSDGITIHINDHAVAQRRTADVRGRVLPSWQGCRRLTRDEVLLLTPEAADSFDGRYFGPLTRDRLIGVALLLWPG